MLQLSQFESEATRELLGHCSYSVHVFSSEEFQGNEFSSTAFKFALAVAAVFGAMAISFVFYDWFVRRRNNIVVHAAAKSDAILSSLFPSVIRDRLFAEKEKEAEQAAINEEMSPVRKSGKKVGTRLENFLSSGEFSEDEASTGSRSGDVVFKSKPIADL